ncbi:uncharacterized protein PG998_011379 [Apiospora kogelbergensis]|uniref:uncharacterized protein n=1 Tax=Apiospora kogelbergensis TaxID=1337665 RepID=UPI00312E8A15
MADKYTLLGCYVDNRTNRTLPVQPVPAYRTNCAQVCHDFCNTPQLQAMFFGLEYGTECWCGTKGNHDNSTFQLAASPDECSYKCPADPTESCGGDFRLSLYSIRDPTPVDLPTSPPGVPPPGGRLLLRRCLAEGTAVRVRLVPQVRKTGAAVCHGPLAEGRSLGSAWQPLSS